MTENIHRPQHLHYLEAYDLEVGILVDFGDRSLQLY